MGKWELFESYWSLSDDEAPITDASSAEDSIIEDAITRYQEVSKEITDRLAALSANKTSSEEALNKFREAATIAYSFARQGDLNAVIDTLEKVI